MRIGVVGTGYAIQSVKQSINPENIYAELVEYPCTGEEVGNLVRRIQPELDGIFFTGYFFFSYACQSTEAIIPWTYAKRTDLSLANALLEISMKGSDIRRITYDLAENSVEQFSNILCRYNGGRLDELHLFRFSCNDYYTITEEEYVRDAAAFHRENIESGKADVCLSGLYGVVQTLTEEGCQALWVRPTVEELNRQFNELSLRHQVRQAQKQGQSSALAVISLQISLPDADERRTQHYVRLHGYHQAETCIYNFAQSIGAAVEGHSGGRISIYTTQPELSAVTEQFSQLGLLQDILLIPHVSKAYAGIGFGLTPGAAKANAEYGEAIAEQRRCSCYYIISDSETVAGPFWAASTEKEQFYGDMWVKAVSQETGVGTATLTQITQVCERFGIGTVTPGRLAELCGMTQSNTNRILTQLEAKGYVRTVGYQPRDGAGRPSRIIQFQLPFE
jgi:hypothetical protein